MPVTKIGSGISEEERRKRFEKAMQELREMVGTGTSAMTTDEIMDMTRGPFNDLDAD